MIIEPCGGYNCISLINNTDLEEENEPTEEYDLNQCGRDRLFINKALQLKISTSVKNTLRPAEYPWLVSIQILPKQKSRFFFKRFVSKVVRTHLPVQLHFAVVHSFTLNGS
jgi:hypothetical protein